MAREERVLLEEIAQDMGASNPQSMTDLELVDYICN